MLSFGSFLSHERKEQKKAKRSAFLLWRADAVIKLCFPSLSAQHRSFLVSLLPARHISFCAKENRKKEAGF